MIHLFDQVYIHHDVFGLYHTKSPERLFITHMDFPVPITTDRNMRARCRIRGVFTELEHCDQEFGTREKFWEFLVNDSPDISLIVDSTVSAELTVQLWKSIFKKHTYETIRTLYLLSVNNENRLALSNTNNNVLQPEHFGNEDFRVFEPIPDDEFRALYEKTPAIECLSNLAHESLSVELLLVSYLVNPIDDKVNTLLFSKMKRILEKTYYESFIDLALTLHRRFSNFNRAEYDDIELELCPYCNIGKIDWLKWTTHPSIQSRDIRAVVRDFSLVDIINIYRDIQSRDIFASKDKADDLIYLGELLLAKDYAKILEEDQVPSSKRGAVLSDRRFREKINPLLISFMYRTKRLGDTEQLEKFSLL